MAPLFAFLNLSPFEMIAILAAGVLLFGRKLPDVGRYLGKTITEFKKGVKGLEDDLDTGGLQRPTEYQPADQIRPPQRLQTTAPKFEDSPTAFTTPPQA